MIDRLRFAIVRTSILMLIVLHTGVDAYGQDDRKSLANRKTNNRPGGDRQITVRETFEPTFSIEPLSHRLEGRSGDVMPFKFKIQTANRTANIEVAPIGLRQELNGQILHDEQSEKADALIRIVSPLAMTIEPDQPATIEGVVQLPRGSAKFHSLGILVKDIGIGDQVKPQFNADGSPKTQAGIRFMTQYVLRLDLAVEGTSGDEARQLVIEDVTMTPFEGRPRLQATVFNPTDTAFEFELRSRLRSSPSDRSFKSLRLVMPIRRGVEDESRYVGRILPKSRIRMEELLPEAIAGGHYDADMELVLSEKVIGRKTMPVDVNSLDFPAQEVLIAQVDDGLQVSPAQIELSKIRGGSRRITMLLSNRSQDSRTIKLQALANNDLEIGTVAIQPREFTLPSNGSRKVSLTLRSSSDETLAVQYGRLLVTAKSSDQDYEVSKALPLAMILAETPEPSVSLSRLQWDPSQPYPGFRATIENGSNVHFPVQARLTIVDQFGRRTSIPGGFGRWLMPQSKLPLDFRFDQPLAPGEYQLRCEVQTKGEPLTVNQAFTVTDIENATTELN